MDPYKPQGACRNKMSAVAVGPGPLTTQQLRVDNSEQTNMRAVVGSCKTRGANKPF